MQRTGVISFDLLLGQPDMLKRYLMVYDELWVPWLASSYPSEQDIEDWELDHQHLAAINYLADEEFIKESPLDPFEPGYVGDPVVRELADLYNTAVSSASQTYETAEEAALESGAASFNMDIAISRATSYLAWHEREQLVHPVVFPFVPLEGVPVSLSETHKVLSIVLKRLPTASEDLPLEDIIAFKRDPDTQYKFAKFWHWTQNLATGAANQHEVEEQLDWLITDYSHHLAQLTKQINHERVEVLVATPAEIAEDLVKMRWSKLVKGLLALRRTKINAHAAELKLPGNEVAYITEASELLTRRRLRS